MADLRTAKRHVRFAREADMRGAKAGVRAVTELIWRKAHEADESIFFMRKRSFGRPEMPEMWPGIVPLIAVIGALTLIAAAIGWVAVTRTFRTFRLMT
jgi:hypothetical protein